MCLTGLPQLYPCSHLVVAKLDYHAMVFLSLSLDITRFVEVINACGDYSIEHILQREGERAANAHGGIEKDCGIFWNMLFCIVVPAHRKTCRAGLWSRG